jgi:hypothetical protein
MTLPVSQLARILLSGAAIALVFALGPTCGARAQDAAKSSHGKSEKKSKITASKSKDSDKKQSGKSTQIGSFGEWGAYQTEGKSKTCYALTQPKSRDPASGKRDSAYIFISYRPAENVKNEISIIMGFPMKDGSEAKAEIGDADFGLIAKGSNAWVKNAAEEGRLIEAMKKGSKLVVKAASAKGKVTTDTYSLGGLGQALDRVRKECP